MMPVTSAKELRGGEGFWYVATPYTLYEEGLEAAYMAARDLDAKLSWARISRFTPIVWSHEIAETSGLDMLDHDFWMDVDLRFMRRARGLIVGLLDGWEKSRGIGQERKFFEEQERPIFCVDPIKFDWVHS